MRRIGGWVLLLLGWLVLIAWAADIPWRLAFSPTHQLSLAGADFRVVMGAGALDGSALKVGSIGPQNSALQSIALDHIAAVDFSILRYRFEGFPRTLELSLVYRRADAPDDVQVIALPWPGSGSASYDLSTIAQWRGEIIELGFAEFPIGQLVPPDQSFKPFTLRGAKLMAPSWRGKLAVLKTDWFGFWPWSQRSVHALGRDTDAPRAHSIVIVLFLGIAMTLAWAWLILGWRGTRIAKLLSGLVLAAWVLLDLRWQTSLWWKHETTRELYAGKTWHERSRLVADTALIDAADRVQQLLRQEPDTTRILLYANSPYEQFRLCYHLLPANVGLLALAVTNSEHASLPVDALIVFYNDTSWPFDIERRALRPNGAVIPAVELLNTGILRVYRLRANP